jgi:hypothetical protein
MVVLFPEDVEAPPCQWDDLCADVRPLILGNLSPRELASAAPTCREFRHAFLARMQEERARLMSVGEQLYGKKVFTGFVEAFRRLMRDPRAYPSLRSYGNILLFDASGEARIVTAVEERERRETGSRIPCIKKTFFPGGFRGKLWTGPSGSQGSAEIEVDFWRGPKGGVQWDIDVMTGGAHAREAAVGFVLAVCEGNPEDLPVCEHSPFMRVTLGLWEVEADTRFNEDLVGPLRFLAESVAYNKLVSHALPGPKGEETGQAYPLGHLAVRS